MEREDFLLPTEHTFREFAKIFTQRVKIFTGIALFSGIVFATLAMIGVTAMSSNATSAANMTLIEVIKELGRIFLNLSSYLSALIVAYGVWVYVLLFLVIFMETGLVLTPYLSGESLLFAAGVLAKSHSLNIWLLLVLFIFASIIGDIVNYWIGHYLGHRAYSIKWIRKEYFHRLHAFFQKHGGKIIFLARFFPVLRTFAPFIAGSALMSYAYFITYNVFGGIVWVLLFTLAGYFFGNFKLVSTNFDWVFIVITLISTLLVLTTPNKLWGGRMVEAEV